MVWTRIVSDSSPSWDTFFDNRAKRAVELLRARRGIVELSGTFELVAALEVRFCGFARLDRTVQ